MKIIKLISISATVAGAMLAIPAFPAFAVDVYVIAHSSLELSGDDVRDVFVGEKQTAGSAKIVPMDNANLQKAFLEKVVKVDSIKYGAIWTKKGFRDGLNPPQVKASDAEVISAVKATPGAIGYVSNAPAGVKVVQKY